MFQCSICERRLHTANPNTWWCSRCYRQYEEDILGKSEWTQYLQNLEASRRYKEKKMRDEGISLIYLGDNDIAEVNSLRKIVYKYRED